MLDESVQWDEALATCSMLSRARLNNNDKFLQIVLKLNGSLTESVHGVCTR